ncbi:MAG: sigma-54 dependent transcriptional regulator [Opitutales bacterium]|tara:strand:- start:1258 stop:2565 length:1308 start_codon:yes stop_codon:yes gene_type:complete
MNALLSECKARNYSNKINGILVLDDEEDQAELIRAFLESYRFCADVTTNPKEAMRLIQNRRYDLIISDYQMPEVNGLEFFQEARKVDPDIPFILVSGVMGMPELVDAANQHVNCVLKKPFKSDDLIEKVKCYALPMPSDAPMGVCSLDIANICVSRPCNYIAGSCYGSRCFFKNLLDLAVYSGNIFIETYSGVEVDLVMKEFCLQQGNKFPEQYLAIQVAELDKPSTQQAIIEYLEKGEPTPAIAVRGFESCSEEDLLFIQNFLQERTHDLGHAVFIYWMTADYLAEHRAIIPPVMMETFKKNQVFLPRLAERIPDIASYANAFFEGRGTSIEWTEEAAGFLFNYTWPNNYDELMLTLEKWAKEGIPKTSPYGGSSLKEALKRYQYGIINDVMLSRRVSLQEALRELGVDEKHIPNESRLDNLGLIYPELLEIGH